MSSQEEDIEIRPEVRQLILAEFAQEFRVVPCRLHNNILELLAATSIVDTLDADEIALILGYAVTITSRPDAQIDRAISTYYRAQNNDQVKQELHLSDDFLENLIRDAKNTASSDIHFEIFQDKGRVRFRIDGKLLERYQIPLAQYPELINKIKIKAGLNITQKRLPQDGRIQYQDFDLRVSIIPTLYGEKVVLRILGKSTGDLDIQALGMLQCQQKQYLQAATAKQGIVLISGPTGSGKTTTLYATLKMLNAIDQNIVTIEDPIEYTLEGVNQVQLREDIGLNFAEALKAFLRQDPDIIMLGEIRDSQTAQMAIRASLTGHLVLSTIHTNSALGTLSRLMDMGVPAFLIAQTLRISVAQRLLRKLCPHCKKPAAVMNHTQFNTTHEVSITQHWEAVGCQNCYYTGYKGRLAIYECIPINSKIKQHLQSNNAITSKEVDPSDFPTLSQRALALVNTGVTSLKEAYEILNS